MESQEVSTQDQDLRPGFQISQPSIIHQATLALRTCLEMSQHIYMMPNLCCEKILKSTVERGIEKMKRDGLVFL